MLFICAAFVNQSQAQQKDEIQAESDAFVYEGNAVLGGIDFKHQWKNRDYYIQALQSLITH